MKRPSSMIAVCLSLLVGTNVSADLEDFTWTEVNPAAAWQPRAGLQVVELEDDFYLIGGRTPIDPQIIPVPGASTIWGDVWKSEDRGSTWSPILETDNTNHWPARAYFEAVTKGDEMFVLGGQDFNVVTIPGPSGPVQVHSSNFFNDVWSSTDGINWTQRTVEAPWEGRAGLSVAVLGDDIYVFGGSKNDDTAIVGPNGPPRVYFNDVWKTSDEGATWQQLTESAPWEPRAGAAVVVKDDFIHLLGGEDGFICEPLPFCSPPYFNDVWRTQDGASWELVNADADWPSRPGHKAAVVDDQIVLFGGFGLITNPIDVWVSEDGASWDQLSGGPWNAASPDEIKYDFDALSTTGPNGSAIYTFGGDRETFDFADPTNYLRVDNDVWRFSPLVPEPTTQSPFLVAAVVCILARSRKRNANVVRTSCVR